jgi:hypothetical protein
MRLLTRALLLLPLLLTVTKPGRAQLPFYTDDSEVTDAGTWHFEFFNEFDALQSAQYPNLQQNTANFKLNYGLPRRLELDVDYPYLSIYRGAGQSGSAGGGDADMGVKWNFRKTRDGSRVPALAASLYIEFPTGSVRKELGSGLHDYWLNFIAEEYISPRTRLTANGGFLFAGNTSTGVVGIETTRGHVFTGGLSLLHDFSARWTLGGEVYGGIADNSGLGRSQLQGLAGGQYTVRDGLSFAFGLIGGKYVASPRIGGQVGFAVDFPDVVKRSRQDPN